MYINNTEHFIKMKDQPYCPEPYCSSSSIIYHPPTIHIPHRNERGIASRILRWSSLFHHGGRPLCIFFGRGLFSLLAKTGQSRHASRSRTGQGATTYHAAARSNGSSALTLVVFCREAKRHNFGKWWLPISVLFVLCTGETFSFEVARCG
jgi:hypothetical protein